MYLSLEAKTGTCTRGIGQREMLGRGIQVFDSIIETLDRRHRSARLGHLGRGGRVVIFASLQPLVLPHCPEWQKRDLAAPAKDYILLLQSLDLVLQWNDVVPKCRPDGALE